MLYTIFRFFSKLFFFIDLLFLTLILLAFSWLPIGRLTQPFVRWLFLRWCAAFHRFLGVKLRIHQHHLNPLPKQYIVIANHPSVFEDIGMPWSFPKAHFLGKEEVASWCLVGRMARAIGCIFVKRESKESRLAAREKMAQAIHEGKSIGIFPEGGCKGRRIYTPFTTGAFDLALETRVPIIPVLIHYEEQEVFEWITETGVGMLWKILWARNKHANYHVFDPLYPSQFKHRDHFRTHVESLFLQWQEKYLD